MDLVADVIGEQGLFRIQGLFFNGAVCGDMDRVLLSETTLKKTQHR